MAGGSAAADAPDRAGPAPGAVAEGPPGAGPVLALALVTGVGLAAQSRVNGAFALGVGDSPAAPVLAALASFGVGGLAVAGVTLASSRARAALRPPRPGTVRPWMLTGGLFGATAVTMAALAVPVIGVALFSVGIVAGQTTGGLLVDRLGLGPGGRRPLSVPRLTGAALAVGAVALGSRGVRGDPGAWLLLVPVTATGLGLALQAAVNARLARALGDPRVASLVSFAGGVAVLAALAAALLVATDPPPLDVPPLALWAGGLAGAAYITLTAAFVARVGVLRLTLAVVAGQLLGAVLADAVVPVPGQGITAAAVAGTVLTFLAVVVAGRSAPRRRPSEG